MKNFIIIVLILIAGYFAYKWIYRSNETVPTQSIIAEQAKEAVSIDVERINKKVDNKGFERALIDDRNQLISNYNELEESSRREIDSLNKVLGIRSNQLKSYISLSFTLRDSLMKATNFGDTLYTYQNDYANISFNRLKEMFSLQYDAKVNITEYWKRDWFLGKKKPYIELWMPDTNASINGVKRLRIEPKTDDFAIKLKGITDYNTKYNEIMLGGGIAIETKRFEYQGNYLYDFNTNKWYPGVRIDLKLLEL